MIMDEPMTPFKGRRMSTTSTSSYYSQAIFDKNHGGMDNNTQTKIYFFGIIDTLTVYNTKKKLEHVVKSMKYGDTISCIPP